jgi:hypothetical protein
MTSLPDSRFTSAPPPAPRRRGLLRRVSTNNPFYVLSAGLFLVGLWISFGAQSREVDTWALMSGLAAYTLLLAVTACLLVRFGNVWDDVRTVLLLVVLMFLATSVTFDEVLVLSPGRGAACYLGGLLFAVAVSEGLLRGMRLALPAWFRLPYYLILALFFLYPLALSPLLDRPHGEALLWGLFGFSAAAGLAFLALLPAVRRGPAYVRGNGSPWRWPLYPWALFGLLGLAVPARAFLLCWSLHLLDGRDGDRLIFGGYFLVPFGLAGAVLLLEAGLVSARRGLLAAALAAPAGLLALALVGHRDDPIYREFLAIFAARLGGNPLWVTLLASAGFYAYAALRRVPAATEALTAALAALAFVGSDPLTPGALVWPRPAPLLAAATLQLALGVDRRHAGRCLLGTAGLVAVVALALPDGAGAAAFHLALGGLLLIGAAFDDGLGRLLRAAGAALVLPACLAALLGAPEAPAGVPSWAVAAYPLVMAALLAGYGLLLGHRFSLAVAGLVLACWLAVAGWWGYRFLRQVVSGLDYLALSLALFALAVLLSLAKSGALSRGIAAGRGEVRFLLRLLRVLEVRLGSGEEPEGLGAVSPPIGQDSGPPLEG